MAMRTSKEKGSLSFVGLQVDIDVWVPKAVWQSPLDDQMKQSEGQSIGCRLSSWHWSLDGPSTEKTLQTHYHLVLHDISSFPKSRTFTRTKGRRKEKEMELLINFNHSGRKIQWGKSDQHGLWEALVQSLEVIVESTNLMGEILRKGADDHQPWT